jgi:hypothetical protein
MKLHRRKHDKRAIPCEKNRNRQGPRKGTAEETRIQYRQASKVKTFESEQLDLTNQSGNPSKSCGKMSSFPNKTAQKMWNLIRLGLHELQTPQDLVIKEKHKNKTANSARHELNYLPGPKIEAQITSSKQGNRRNFQNFPRFKHPGGKQKTSKASPDRRARPPLRLQNPRLGPISQAAAPGRADAPIPRAPLPSSKTAGSRGPTGGPGPQCDGGTEGEKLRQLRNPRETSQQRRRPAPGRWPPFPAHAPTPRSAPFECARRSSSPEAGSGEGSGLGGGWW